MHSAASVKRKEPQNVTADEKETIHEIIKWEKYVQFGHATQLRLVKSGISVILNGNIIIITVC